MESGTLADCPRGTMQLVSMGARSDHHKQFTRTWSSVEPQQRSLGRTHARCLYHAFSAAAVAGSSTTASQRRRISVIFSLSEASKAAITARALRWARGIPAMARLMRFVRSVQPSFTRSCSPGLARPVFTATKFSIHRVCQPGSVATSAANWWGSVGVFPRTSTLEGVRWNTSSSLHAAAKCGMHCTEVAPVPTIATRLSPSRSSGAAMAQPPPTPLTSPPHALGDPPV
eukprot:COSAG01_NODE_5244_length_4388_cov_6.643740_6_plen_229_part_00